MEKEWGHGYAYMLGDQPGEKGGYLFGEVPWMFAYLLKQKLLLKSIVWKCSSSCVFYITVKADDILNANHNPHQ